MSAKRSFRHRVVMRPKVRRKRLQFQLAFLTLAGLVVLAVVLLRQSASRWPQWKTRLTPRASRLVAAPELAPFLDGALGSSRGDWKDQAAELKRRFPFIKSVDAGISWLDRELTLKVEAHRAVGRVKSAGTKHSFLSADGVVFTAPAGLYTAELPHLDLRGAQEGEWGDLAGTLDTVGRAGNLASPLSSVRYVSGADGWTAVLEDGTEVLWGPLRWTSEKLARLKAVLDDARARPSAGLEPGAALTADLRYFEDGRILLRARPGR